MPMLIQSTAVARLGITTAQAKARLQEYSWRIDKVLAAAAESAHGAADSKDEHGHEPEHEHEHEHEHEEHADTETATTSTESDLPAESGARCMAALLSSLAAVLRCSAGCRRRD